MLQHVEMLLGQPDPEDDITMILQNVSNYLPVGMA
jgi:hypothetical protein